jgi:hypothetical protein
MFRQFSRGLAAQCGKTAWVHAGTHVLCSPEEVQQFLERPNRQAWLSCAARARTRTLATGCAHLTFTICSSAGSASEAVPVFGDQEHLYPNSAPSSAPLAVLYGQIGTPSFAAFHTLLR